MKIMRQGVCVCVCVCVHACVCACVCVCVMILIYENVMYNSVLSFALMCAIGNINFPQG